MRLLVASVAWYEFKTNVDLEYKQEGSDRVLTSWNLAQIVVIVQSWSFLVLGY